MLLKKKTHIWYVAKFGKIFFKMITTWATFLNCPPPQKRKKQFFFDMAMKALCLIGAILGVA
jgi:hypothetical protein